MTNPRRAAAIAYLRMGWSVVPMHTPIPDGGCSCGRDDCPAAGKHPRIAWQRHMHEAATEETVDRWWERWPDANIGVVTGMVSDVAVVDVDPRNRGDVSLQTFEERWGPLPATATSRTGGGGWHYWFSGGGEPLPSRELAPGLELKGDGAVVVAPPSMHTSGMTYRWLADPATLEPAPVPLWLLADPGVTTSPSTQQPLPRTDREQEEFTAAWHRAGIDLIPGDRYYLCPFHDDHHPSLHVDREGCRWYCFGCGRGGGIGALLHELGEERRADRKRLRGRVGPRLPITLSGDRTVDVVGESHHQDALLTICGGRRHYGGVELETVAELVPDPENRFDPHAVEVVIDGFVVGHLSREDAVRLRPAIDACRDLDGRAACPATIRGGWDRGRGDVGLFGVTLQVSDEADR